MPSPQSSVNTSYMWYCYIVRHLYLEPSTNYAELSDENRDFLYSLLKLIAQWPRVHDRCTVGRRCGRLVCFNGVRYIFTICQFFTKFTSLPTTRGSGVAEGPRVSGTLHWRLSKLTELSVVWWVGGTTGSASYQQSTNDRRIAGSRPTEVVCITVLTGNRMG